MNETEFQYIGDIENFEINFKCFDLWSNGGYQATFHIYDKLNRDLRYKVDFFLSGTEYNSDWMDFKESFGIYIENKYGGIENCFKKVGIFYLKNAITHSGLKNETVSIVTSPEIKI
jgi:hypothetical protein